MSRMHHVVALAPLLLAAAAFYAPAHAAGATPKGDKPASAMATAAPAGLSGATGNARVMALVAPGGGAVRAKGVASITHPPQTGAYCIKPADSSIKPNTLIPSVSVDYTTTAFTDAIVQFRSTRVLCPSGTFEVLTLVRPSVGQPYTFSEQVQFSFVAP